MKTPAAVLLLLTAVAAQAQDDALLKAMRDEVTRSASIRAGSLETPYYIELSVGDVDQFTATATEGSLIRATRGRFRQPQVSVRVGARNFDSSNYIGSTIYSGDRLPLDENPQVFRRVFWLAIDRAYKGAVESISRKRAALKNVNTGEQLPDFGPAPPLKLIQPLRSVAVDEEAWKSRLREWSKRLAAASPNLRLTSVDFDAATGPNYFVNSEGTEVRTNEEIFSIRARAGAQAEDGMMVFGSAALLSNDIAKLNTAGVPAALDQLAAGVAALAQAPAGETYSGPVLFEDEAAAQLFASLLGKNFVLMRRPVLEPGMSGFPTNDLEGRQGSRVLPESFDVVDDATQTEWRGRPLLGHYLADLEGVKPEPVTLVEKGVLRNFLLTRQPQRNLGPSNGHARMPGAFGASQASFSNLFVRASGGVSADALKTKLIELIQARGKPYGLLIRKLDYPSTAGADLLRRYLGRANLASARPAPLPLAVYKVTPDGKMELVRGLRFRGLGVRNLRDIIAAGNAPIHFDMTDSPTPLSMVGGGGFLTLATVVAPSVLIDDVELERIEEEFQKPPIVPPPPSAP